LVISLKDIVSWRGINGNCVNSTKVVVSKDKMVSGICSEIKGIWGIPSNLSRGVYKGIVLWGVGLRIHLSWIERKGGRERREKREEKWVREEGEEQLEESHDRLRGWREGVKIPSI
jgi:hypothetical protein